MTNSSSIDSTASAVDVSLVADTTAVPGGLSTGETMPPEPQPRPQPPHVPPEPGPDTFPPLDPDAQPLPGRPPGGPVPGEPVPGEPFPPDGPVPLPPDS